MSRQSLSLFALLCLIVTQVVQGLEADWFPPDDVSHAFVQTDSELHYFRDVAAKDLPVFSQPPEPKADPPGEPLSLFPKSLNFGSGSLGVARRLSVVISNTNPFDVVFLEVGSLCQSFFAAFPSDKLLKPGRNTTLVVTFLAHSKGEHATTLFIRSSHFVTRLQVSGVAWSNPYRLRHHIKAKLPVKGTFDFPITVHNPHPEKMRIKRLISSHNYLLVTTTTLGEAIELIPFETSTVAMGSVVGAAEGSSTMFIILKTSIVPYGPGPEIQRDLIITVDVEVTKERGIFATSDVLDFGLVRFGDHSQRLVLSAYSTVEKGLEIESIYVVRNSHPTFGLYLQYASKPPISVMSGALGQPGAPVPIANVHLDTNYFTLNTTEKYHPVSGQIVAESRGGNYNVTVDFKAVILVGGISQKIKDAAFHLDLATPIERVIALENNYSVGLGIWNVTMDAQDAEYFTVSLLQPVVEIGVGELRPALLVSYIKTPPGPYSASCVVSSNVTDFKVSMLVFHGKVEVVELQGFKLQDIDLGDMTVGEARSYYITVVNTNPVPLALKSLSDPVPERITITPLGSSGGNGTRPVALNMRNQGWQSKMDFLLPANSHTSFNITVRAALSLAQQSVLHIETEFEKFDFLIKYNLCNSSLRFVDPVIDLGESFPGKIVNKPIMMYSNDERPVRILKLMTLTDDHRFNFRVNKSKDLVANPGEILNLGDLTFSQDVAYGQWFTHGMKLPPNLPEIDSYLYQRLRMRWHALENKKVQTKVLVDTDHFKSLQVEAHSQLSWPRLFNPVVYFPHTAVGNFTILNLTLTNPSVHPVIVQLLPLVIYPDAEALLEFFRDEFPAPLVEPVEMNETLMFSLRDTELFTLRPNSPVPALREQLEKVVNRQVPRFTLSMIVQPGMKVRVRIGFLPTDYTMRSSLLLIRNNLTALEPVVLYGRGARVGLEIDGKSAREAQLVFDILMSHLSDCYNPKRLTHKLGTNLTVKRSFFLKNVGEVDMWIVNVSISGTNCADRGFRVLNCKPFVIQPNQTYTFDIAYTPDFLMSINEATLQLFAHMNGTPWTFDLVATIAPEMLEVCHAALPRPPFEWVMYYACLFALVFCMICISACAYLEADRCLTGMICPEFEQRNAVDLPYIMTNAFRFTVVDWYILTNFLFYSPLSVKYRHVFRFEFSPVPVISFIGHVLNRIVYISANIWLTVRRGLSSDAKLKKDKKQKTNDVKQMDALVNKMECDPVEPVEKENVQPNNHIMKKDVRRRKNATKKRVEQKQQDHYTAAQPRKPSQDFDLVANMVKDKLTEAMRKTKVVAQTESHEAQASDTCQSFDKGDDVHLVDSDAAILQDETGSPPPEWADEVINSSDIARDFEFLAEQSSNLFHDDLHSPDSAEEPSNPGYSWLSSLEIDRLVTDYRQRLLDVAKAEPASGVVWPVPPPLSVDELLAEVPDPVLWASPPPDATYFASESGRNFYDQLLLYQQERQREHDMFYQQLYQQFQANPFPVQNTAEFQWFTNEFADCPNTNQVNTEELDAVEQPTSREEQSRDYISLFQPGDQVWSTESDLTWPNLEIERQSKQTE